MFFNKTEADILFNSNFQEMANEDERYTIHVQTYILYPIFVVVFV